jgi:uncharacterized protein
MFCPIGRQQIARVAVWLLSGNFVRQVRVQWAPLWLAACFRGYSREADDWPIPGTAFTNYYLESLGQANTRYGNGILSLTKPDSSQPADHFVYDPANPVPSIGGHSCCTPDIAPVGPYDQAKVEDRADVLVYSTRPLEKPTEVTGPVQVILYAASSAPDTDFNAKLVDVHPDGKAYNLGNGIIRASSRQSLE